MELEASPFPETLGGPWKGPSGLLACCLLWGYRDVPLFLPRPLLGPPALQ